MTAKNLNRDGFIDACTKRQSEHCPHGRNNDVGRCTACVIDEAAEQLSAMLASRAALQASPPADVSRAEWAELRALLEVEHEHVEGRNECAICDESLVSAAIREIKKYRALQASPDVAGAINRALDVPVNPHDRPIIRGLADVALSLSAQLKEKDRLWRSELALVQETRTQVATLREGLLKESAFRQETEKQRAALEAECAGLQKSKRRLADMLPLFQEARDALPAITLLSAQLRGIPLDLAERMDAVGVAEQWEALDAERMKP